MSVLPEELVLPNQDTPAKVNSETTTPCYGVSLVFIKSFIEKFNISDTMTTDEVVNQIIIPETIGIRTEFVQRVKHIEMFCSDLRYDHRNKYSVVTKGTAHSKRSVSHHISKTYFFSHCWQMPFVNMVSIIENVGRETNGDVVSFAKHSYFWIDVFCKNQHVPAPAMDEFKMAMISAGGALFGFLCSKDYMIIFSLICTGELVIALWPRKPIAVTRIWCLYELWCAINNKIHINASFVDNDKLAVLYNAMKAKDKSSLFEVKVENATARRPEDIVLILDIIESSVGVTEMNKIVNKEFGESVHRHLAYSKRKYTIMAAAAGLLIAVIIVAAATNIWAILIDTVYPSILLFAVWLNTYCNCKSYSLDTDF